MRSKQWLQLVSILSFVGVAACGARTGGRTAGAGDGSGDSDQTGGSCALNSECRSGLCSGGYCADAETCTKHSDCNAGQYCHFPSTSPWVTNTEGTCAGPCTGDNSCGIIGQSCLPPTNGRCYTNIECNPANNSTDCPPGEVCNQQSRACTAPPAQCYLNSNCPAGWQCSPEHKCIDPDNVARCDTAAQCDNTQGCAPGACECFDHGCRITGSCTPATEYTSGSCGAGKYCAGNRCQTATACPGDPAAPETQNPCTPYGLVCKSGYCTNPPPCNSGSCSAYGPTPPWACHTNTNPPTCSPGAECTSSSMCPAGSYCDIPSASCKEGCRDNAECQSTCPGAPAVCSLCNNDPACDYCGNSHKCTVTPSSGGACTDNSQCAAGMACAADPTGDATMDGLCLAAGGMVPELCTMSCRVVCDILGEMTGPPTCPAGQQCGSGGSDFLSALIPIIMQALMGGGGTASPTASVCYPAP